MYPAYYRKIYQPSLKFGGIKPPYKTSTHLIYPLSIDISQKQIDYFEKELYKQKKSFDQGNNGKVYLVSSPFENIKGNVVVKIHKGENAGQKDDLKEVHALDLLESLWEEKKLGTSQRGLVAFKPKAGFQHIVSTFVPGKIPNINTAPLTDKVLRSCIEQIITLDKGTAKHGRFLHSDLKSPNMHVSPFNAGFYDWEFMHTVPLENSLALGRKRKPGYEKYHDYIKHIPPDPRLVFTLYDTADTFPFKTNMKHFEARLICPYLSEFIQVGHKKEGRIFFQRYLQEKAFYHRSMQSHYAALAKDIEQKGQDGLYSLELKRLLEKVSRFEAIHANLLTGENGQTPMDILKAELYKMQLAHYGWRSKGNRQLINFNGKPMGMNGKQIGKLFDRAKAYFQEYLLQATLDKDSERKRYYKNCLMIIQVLDKPYNSPRPVFKFNGLEVGKAKFYDPVRFISPDGPHQIELNEELYGSKAMFTS